MPMQSSSEHPERFTVDAENTHRVSERLWSSGQLSERDIAALPGLGVRLVVNLALPTSVNALPGEAELVTRQGIDYVHIPVVWERPEPEQFDRFVAVLDAWRGSTVWVHCAKNMRVSAFLYLYRSLVLGEPEEEARFPLRDVWEPDAVWQTFIDAVKARHAASGA